LFGLRFSPPGGFTVGPRKKDGKKEKLKKKERNGVEFHGDQ